MALENFSPESYEKAISSNTVVDHLDHNPMMEGSNLVLTLGEKETEIGNREKLMEKLESTGLIILQLRVQILMLSSRERNKEKITAQW